MKKILAAILLIFYFLFSSGIVVYAFECVELKHVHINLLHKIDCSGFPDEAGLHHTHNHETPNKISNNTFNNNLNNTFNNNLNNIFNSTELISCDCYHKANNLELNFLSTNSNHTNNFNNSSIETLSASCGISKTIILNIGIDILHVVENLSTLMLAPLLEPPAFLLAQYLIDINKFYFQIDNSPPKRISSCYSVCYIRTITSTASSESDKSSESDNYIFRFVV